MNLTALGEIYGIKPLAVFGTLDYINTLFRVCQYFFALLALFIKLYSISQNTPCKELAVLL